MAKKSEIISRPKSLPPPLPRSVSGPVGGGESGKGPSTPSGPSGPSGKAGKASLAKDLSRVSGKGGGGKASIARRDAKAGGKASLARGKASLAKGGEAKPTAESAESATALIEALLKVVRATGAQRFQQREEIGRGGVGSVSVVMDHVLHRPIAMKALLDAVRGQPIMVRAFIREAQITAQLDHPNIVPVHDIGIAGDGRLFFTMKQVEGRTLARVLEDSAEDKQTIDSAYDNLLNLLEIIIKVCDALAFAHSRGVLHCDIKAQNIMVGDFGQVYLMDWGFAQLVQAPKEAKEPARRAEDLLPALPLHATRGFVFGTPGYMSPEQARGEQMDERSDVFSLGALIYQALTGDVPYRAKSPAETVLLAQSATYPPLEEQSVGGYSLRPKELVRIVGRAMSRRPEDRYQSVEALKLDLVHFVRGGSSFPTRRVATGTQIIREGETADAAYIIVSGECEVYRNINGKRVSLQILKAGDVFGEMALLASAPRMASVVAVSEAALVVVTRDVVEQELSSMKPWMGAFIRALATRFRDYQETHFQQVAPADSADEVEKVSGRPWWKLW